MICVSIGEPTIEKCMAALKGVDFAEIRIDRIKDGAVQIPTLFVRHRRLIATCRPGTLDDEKRRQLLERAIEAGAAFVDIELEADDGYKKSIINKARNMGCGVILSYHNFTKTPERAELEHIIDWCFDSGTDIAKVACKVLHTRDNARLLGLLNEKKPVVVIGMGKKGQITRIVAPLLGSPFTYAALAPGRETAEGQLDKGTLESILRRLRND